MDPGGKIYTIDEIRCWKVENLDDERSDENKKLKNEGGGYRVVSPQKRAADAFLSQGEFKPSSIDSVIGNTPDFYLLHNCMDKMGESRKKFDNFKVKGCVCAPFTLLKDDGEINFDGFEDYAKYLVSQKFSYLFVNGTLAEGLSMTLEERKQTAEAWMKVSKDRFGIILHIGANNYKDSQELARHAEKIGVDAIACFAPGFYKAESEEILVEYISKVASAAPNTPFYYYCINFFTGVYLNDARFLELAEDKIPNLVGLKHSSRELPNAHRCMLLNPKKFQVMIGSDVQLLSCLSLGIEVPVIASFLGQLFDKIKSAFDAGDMETARKYQCEAQQIYTIRADFGGGINVAKAIFNIVSGLNAGPVRLPLKDLSKEQKQQLKVKIDVSGLYK